MGWNPLNFAADYTMKMYDKSDDLANSRKLDEKGWNSPRDAVRHAYTSAVLTKDTNSALAKTLGYAHEVPSLFGGITDTVERQDSMMDIYNNSVGRQIGREAKEQGWNDEQIGQEVLKALDRGQLVTDRAKMDPHGSVPDPNWKP